MNIRLLTLLGLCLASGLQVQAQASGDASAPKRTPEELSELLGPIALYPDPLVSLVLPAATVPSEIVLADRFVISGGDPATVDEKPWDSSVKALTRYPDTLKWLDDNVDWTAQVGDAFVSQPVEVMEAIQALRAKAKAMGNLVDTPEERVVQDDNDIRIVPAQPDAIYVPSYDPEIVYYQRATAHPLVYFSSPYIVGPWLGFDFDWRHRHLYRSDWHEGWDYRSGRDRQVFIDSRVTAAQVWRVDARRRQVELSHPVVTHIAAGAAKISVPHPKPLVVAPRSSVVAPRTGVKAPGAGPEAIKPSTGRAMPPRTAAPGIPGEAVKPHSPSGKPAPAMREAAPNVGTPAPRVGEPALKPREAAPKLHEAAPKPHEPALQPHEAAPKPHEAAPKPHEAAPKPHEAAPKAHSEVKKKDDKKDKKEP